MSEDADAKPARPQRTTRSERRRASRRPEAGAADANATATEASDDEDAASSFDTLVDVEVSSTDDAPVEGEAAAAGEASASATGAAASRDSFEALDEDDNRPTREMTVVPLDVSEDDKTMPRIRVDEIAARLQASRPDRDARVEAPATPSRPTVAAEPELADADETTNPRIVVKGTSVVIASSRIIGVVGDDDVAPRMASRPPPPSTPLASSASVSSPVSLPRPPVVAQREAPAQVAVLDEASAVDGAIAGDAGAEVEEQLVDVDEAEIEGSTPPPPPSEGKARGSVVPPRRPPPPPAAPLTVQGTAAAPPPPPPVAPAAVVAAPPPPPPPVAPAAATAAPAPPIASAPSQPVAVPRPEDEQKKRKQARQWWERFFSEDYLRAVQPPTQAQIAHQIDFVVESLGLERGATILDVGCGLGLHCVELTRRGYLTVGLDLSLAMITRAAEAAQRQSLKINFLHADIREMQFDGAFDAAICMGTTFGFFDDESNRDVLARLHQALRPGGRLLLDVANRDYVMPMQPNLVWFEGDGCVCMEESDFNHYTSRLSVKRTMMREDGTQASSEYSLRLYSLHELGQLVQQMGFRVLEVSGQEAVRGAFFGACAPRIMVLAERRTPTAGRLSQVMPPERPSTEVSRPPATTERGTADVPKPPPPKPPSGPQSA